MSAYSPILEPPWAFDQCGCGEISAADERWARALCQTHFVKPDKMIGEPKHPRWHSYVPAGRHALAASKIVERGS